MAKAKLPKPSRSPLAPTPTKKLRKQALKTMKKVYKPEFADLNEQEKRLLAINEKRKLDNQYYTNWLKTQNDELNAHAQAADAALQSAQNQIHDENAQAYQAMQQQLVDQGGQHAQTVSNPAQSSSFNVSGEQQRGLERIAAERLRTEQQINSAQKTRSTVAASNFALMAAAEANRVANMWSGLKDISSGKTKLRLARAADTAKEVARLLDKEIDKAQIRGELKSQAAQLGLDRAELQETKRHNQATEKDAALEGKSNPKGDGKGKGKKGDEVGQRAKRAESRKITNQINNGVSFVANDPNLNTQLQSNPTAVKQALQKQGLSPLYAQAVLDLMTTGKLVSTTRQRLKQQGYIIPPAWR